MASSRDSSQPPSRPASTTLSPSNASVAFSHADSTTPVFSRARTSPLPPNKLVKRASSVRSTLGSPSQSPGSRLPLPVFKRPATSHQRSATMQDHLSDTSRSDRLSLDAQSSLPPDARDTQLRNYFTPRIAADELLPGRRRNSTGIPNPIKRIYPDRKYKPVLVSSKEGVKRPAVQVDERPSSRHCYIEALFLYWRLATIRAAAAMEATVIRPEQNYFDQVDSKNEAKEHFSTRDIHGWRSQQCCKWRE
ncbi:hypothetical protein KC331_g20316 [Hortaea werneckii]|nr:hypothetical protein KC331_g20316 [Hortaea werneckii]